MSTWVFNYQGPAVDVDLAMLQAQVPSDVAEVVHELAIKSVSDISVHAHGQHLEPGGFRTAVSLDFHEVAQMAVAGVEEVPAQRRGRDRDKVEESP